MTIINLTIIFCFILPRWENMSSFFVVLPIKILNKMLRPYKALTLLIKQIELAQFFDEDDKLLFINFLCHSLVMKEKMKPQNIHWKRK